MDEFTQLFTTIFSLSICGVSLGTIIGVAISVVKKIAKSKREVKKEQENMQKQIEVTKSSIETAFKDAVLPKTIKIDVSKKIKEPIETAMVELKKSNDEQLDKVKEELRLVLKVLNQFTHVQKLSQEDQEKIQDIVDAEVTEEVEV